MFKKVGNHNFEMLLKYYLYSLIYIRNLKLSVLSIHYLELDYSMEERLQKVNQTFSSLILTSFVWLYFISYTFLVF